MMPFPARASNQKKSYVYL